MAFLRNRRGGIEYGPRVAHMSSRVEGLMCSIFQVFSLTRQSAITSVEKLLPQELRAAHHQSAL